MENKHFSIIIKFSVLFSVSRVNEGSDYIYCTLICFFILFLGEVGE